MAGDRVGDRSEPQPAGPLVTLLVRRGLTIGIAESLTGGLLAAALTDVPGASATFRGAVVAYATDVKCDVLAVPAGLVAARGVVDPDVAAAMAVGAREVLGSDLGVATTGVAGPEPQDGAPVGLVFVAVATADSTTVRELDLSGSRDEVRRSTVLGALRLVAAVVEDGREEGTGRGR